MHDFKRGGWVINLRDLELGVLIGEGNFGGQLIKIQCVYVCVGKDIDTENVSLENIGKVDVTESYFYC